MYYSKKSHMNCINCVFAFAPDGTIVWARLNVPGSMNDTEACRPLTAVIQDPTMTLPFYVSFGDVAFKGETADGSTPAYLTPATAADLVNNKENVHHRLALTYWVLRKRQAIEWCMSTLKVCLRASAHAGQLLRSQARVAPVSLLHDSLLYVASRLRSRCICSAPSVA
jgi:hypothetical protein